MRKDIEMEEEEVSKHVRLALAVGGLLRCGETGVFDVVRDVCTVSR